MRAEEGRRLTEDLKEKVRLVQEQWNSALGEDLKNVKERTREWLLETGGWDETLEEESHHEILRSCSVIPPWDRRPGCPQAAGGVSNFKELSLSSPYDYRAGSYTDAWYRLNYAQYQAPHAAYTEDQCFTAPNKLCYSFNTYLFGKFLVSIVNHDGGVTGTDLSWWVVEYFDNPAKESDYGHSGDAHVTKSRIFNIIK
ncbi:hypothetical protein NQ176_g10731 [Zarea fungicola]|uniref:Uncharacterized protein n=1 Tax=Zarea fungicola TaxID=93591 RepID=A0ACC1MG24_9HYPO|nr:hypothetical protein NQ176_g10731 [Lecanicillium fungicola]